jgi:hypothetical protein
MPCDALGDGISIVFQGVAFDCRASHVAACMGDVPIDEFGPASGRHEERFALPRIMDSRPDGPADGVSYTKTRELVSKVDGMSKTRSLEVMKLPAEVFSSNLAGRQVTSPKSRLQTATPPTTRYLMSSNLCCNGLTII